MIRQRKLTRLLAGLGSLVPVAGLILQAALPGEVSAATQITARSLTLEAGATDGGSKPGGTVKHLFSFTLSDLTDSIGSIKFQYCTTAASVPSGIGCVAPGSGGGTEIPVSTQNAALLNQTGVTGFTSLQAVQGADDAADTVYNEFILERTAASAIGGSTPVPVTYELGSIINPGPAQTFFVRITTYSSLDGSGTALEAGTVAAATSTQINLSGTMPESLVFCAGATVGLNGGGVPDCSTVTTGNVSFNKLFSPTDTATATSQMAASTNAGSGYVITVNGSTLTSGSNTITAMGTAAGSTQGISQFGMNLKDNTTASSNPAVGTEVAPVSNGTNYNGQAAAGYNTVDTFKYVSGDPVANSNSLGTDAQIFTSSYIVNVPGSQPAGNYTTTLTYICTPTF